MPAQQRGSKRARTEEEPASAGVVALHRTRFIDWQPTGVVALAASGDGSLVAAGREDGDIELYETSTSHCFQRIPGHKDACLTCLALVDEDEGKGSTTSRLFSSGLDGALLEWDVERRQAGPAADSMGGAVWQLAAEPGACIKPGGDVRLAAACDDGAARIFVAQAGAPGLTFSRALPRVEGRTLAVAWHPSGRVLASAGTDGCIHLWSLDSSQEVLRITAGDGSGAAAAAHAAVWALLVLRDGTVVSGDSGGNVQFWDGRFGTLLASFRQHQADVLALAASPDGEFVFAAGVDPQLAVFQRLPADLQLGGKQPGWALLSAKRPHTHDVRALCVAAGRALPEGARLWSGGNDTQLYNHSVAAYLKEHPIRVNACPQPPLAGVARPPLPPGEADGGEAPPAWLLCAQRHTLDLWELGDAEAAAAPGAAAAPPAEGALLPPGDPPEHLLRLSLTAGRHVVAAAISADGRWLACSDASRLACFALEQRGASEEVPEAHVVPVPLPLPRDLPPAAHLAFRPATHQLLALASDGTLRIVDMEAAAQRQRAEAGVPNGLHHGEGGADGGGGAGGVVTVRALHDLQYKSSQRRERQRSAARRLWPLVELAAVSPDGAWLAAVVRQRVHLLSLASHKLGAALPPLAEPQPPLTALAFTADSAEVAVAAASHQVATYGVASGQPSAWTAAHGGSLPPKLLRMPGAIRSIASCPAAPSSLFLASSEACCHLDTAAPLEGEEGGGGGRKRRRQKPVLASEPPGANCRMIYCADPVLHAAYLAPRSLLVVERPWSEVYKKIAAPMYRHRYGT